MCVRQDYSLDLAAGLSRGSSRNSSPASNENSAVAAELRGCITMSHPGGISCRCNRTISRSRRRMRFRRTAPPRVLRMLQPNRLCARPLGRRKTVNSRPDRRRPSRYTASYSPRRTNRLARGKPPGASDARETVASFLSALRKDFASTRALHACAEPVLLMSGAHMGLIGAFRQRSLSSGFAGWALRSVECDPAGAPLGPERIS